MTTDIDVAFDVLSDVHRRQVLQALRDERSMTLSSAARLVADGGQVDGDNAETMLYHVHLPMLADAEFVRWEAGEKTVERGAQFDTVRPILEVLD